MKNIVYKPMLQNLNLTYPQYLVMLILWSHEKISFKDMNEFDALLKKIDKVGTYKY